MVGCCGDFGYLCIFCVIIDVVFVVIVYFVVFEVVVEGLLWEIVGYVWFMGECFIDVCCLVVDYVFVNYYLDINVVDVKW